MPDMSFGDFLGKMSGETNRPKTKKKPLREEKAKKEEPKTQKEEPRREKPEEEREKTMPKTNKKDDIIVKAMDYSTKFMKVIYENFSDEKDRTIVLKSIRSAIDLAIGDSTTSYNQNTNTQFQSPPSPQKPEKAEQATNENIEIKMNDLSGQAIDIQQQQPHNEEDIYRQELNIGLKVGNDGKQEVDLSRLSANDMHEMRVLAGVDPEQKAREQKSGMINEAEIEEIERGGDGS